MDDRAGNDSRRIEIGTAHNLLARAAELDVEAPASITVAELRQAAAAAGIAREAFDAALAELPADHVVAGGQTPSRRAPKWVRLCLFGVPDRRTAMAFYWVFATASVIVPLWVAARVPTPAGAIAGTGFLLVFLFACWGTSQGVKWADAHGWDAI